MAELIVSVLQLVGFFIGKWLLPRITRGRFIILPRDAVIDRFSVALYHRLPDGRFGVSGEVVGSLFALLIICAIVGLCLLLL